MCGRLSRAGLTVPTHVWHQNQEPERRLLSDQRDNRSDGQYIAAQYRMRSDVRHLYCDSVVIQNVFKRCDPRQVQN